MVRPKAPGAGSISILDLESRIAGLRGFHIFPEDQFGPWPERPAPSFEAATSFSEPLNGDRGVGCVVAVVP